MTPTRRKLMYGGAATAAVLAGAGAGWLRLMSGADPAVEAFWTTSFERPEGGSLSMAALRGQPVLVNFWATWCPPCVEELPLLDSFFRQHAAKRWQVIGLAIDQPSAVRGFLAKLPLSFPIGLAGFDGTELGKSLGNLTGGLPFTVVLGANGGVQQRKMGRVSPADLAAWAQAHSIS